MTPLARKLFLSGTVILVLVYFFPIWHIGLEAPQYPEGIGMYIWLDKITGQNPHDLANINNLNHYIGMKKIVPDAIPELKIMPYVIGFIILFGIFVYFINRKWLFWIWIILFVSVLFVGLYDFYLWEYDYGHDLDPMAAIKVPGMSYQPPLIGSKKLLNFTSTSLPAFGGIVVGLSVLIGIASVFIDSKLRKKK